MTLSEIEKYLRKHRYLIFRYNNDYFTLRMTRPLFKTRYSLIPTDAPSQHRPTLEELCDNVIIDTDTSLRKAIQSIEMLDWNNSSWESFEAIRHCAIVHGTEIQFSYEGKDYWIAHTEDGLSHLSDEAGNTQFFGSCKELFSNARINGESLNDIWEKVIVKNC